MLGAGTAVREYGVGVIGPNPRATAAGIVLAFAAIVVVAVVFFHVILVPGVLFVVVIAAIYGAIDRPASFVVTDRGLVVLARSEVNGRPRRVITVLPESVLIAPTVRRSGGYVHLPELHVWIRRDDHERLVSATGATLTTSRWATPVPAGVGATNAPGGNLGTPPPVVSAAPNGTAAQPINGAAVIYCSWCGQQRAVNAQAIHYCGSMERPAVYCMRCGTTFHEGAAACGSCGTPATELSR